MGRPILITGGRGYIGAVLVGKILAAGREAFVLSRSVDGLPKGARHPHAAVLLLDFILSKEGQQILASAEYFPVRADVEPLPKLAKVKPDRAGYEENFISPEQLNKYTDGSIKMLEELFR